jgi:hypothetical protein
MHGVNTSVYRLQRASSLRAAKWCYALSAEGKPWPTQWYDNTRYATMHLLWCPPPLLPPHPIIAGMCVCKDPSVAGLLVPCTPTPTGRREFFVSIGLAMIALMGGELASFAPQTGATGPVLASATITARSDLAGGGVQNE